MIRASLFILVTAITALAQTADADRDGLDDGFEQQLLQQFVPAFRVSEQDCDLLPSAFGPGAKSIARDGTIYGQVFPAAGGAIEVHYYHLWSRDCGRLAHALDAEHVSALLRFSEGRWKAVYWYAAAHEDTVCDAGNGARALAIGATENGPAVWVSHGKHASYLSERLCRHGCGGDRCGAMTRMQPARIVNIGEPGAPLNDASWVTSGAWPLAAKMRPDFNDWLIRQLDSSRLADGVISLTTPLVPFQSVILAGGATADSMDTAQRHTGDALAVSYNNVDKSLRKAGRATRNWLDRMW